MRPFAASWRGLTRGMAVAATACAFGGLVPSSWAQHAASGDGKGMALGNVPIPHQVHSRAKPLETGRSALAEFDTAPFPYRGRVPRTDRPFLDVAENGRRFRRGARGQILWEDETFRDNRVLLHIPPAFDVRRPGIMIVFFHGHGATLADDVFMRQQVPAQMAGTNAVLIAPQLAVKAADSSAGKLWHPGAFARFVGEAASHLARLHGDRRSARSFASMPVVIVAYSGGYTAAAWSAHHGGLGKRLRGVVLLDALYGEVDKFADWIASDPTRLFVSAYTSSTRRGNAELQKALNDRHIPYLAATDLVPGNGNIVFLSSGSGSLHRDFLTHAWSEYPLATLLGQLSGYQSR
jgi:hypothetical protein